MKKFIVEELHAENTPRVILTIKAPNGKIFEVDVRADMDDDGGIVADIARDGVHVTSAEFGWDDKHENEEQ